MNVSKFRNIAKLLVVLGLLASGSLFAQKRTNKKNPPLHYSFTKDQGGSLFLNAPGVDTVEYDENIKRYVIVKKVGDYQVKTPLFMSTTEYQKYRLQKDIDAYYKKKISALNSDKKGSKEEQKNLLPTYYVNSTLFSTIFGGNAIEVDIQGALDVSLGGLYQNVENPNLSEDNRKSFSFDFDQQVTASIAAKIGERLKVTANYDTKSTFDFQNLVKVEFVPSFSSKNNDDIVKKIEIGNVNMNTSNNLIAGSQSLFGFKTQVQFGPTTITSVFSQQKSESKTVTAQGGSTLNEFELLTSQYDVNRHFFLTQFFRNEYNDALAQLPLISSSVNITAIEVWVTNRSSETTDVRNIVAITDLGESGTDYYDDSSRNISNPKIDERALPGGNPDNTSNELEDIFYEGSGIRDIGTVKDELIKIADDVEQGSDYTILENAKKLDPSEFTFNPQLGTISLRRQLTDGDVLGVAFQYTLNTGPEVYRVGELSTDGIASEENLVVKMLRSEIIEPGKNIWDLMMKNIYSLGAYQMNQDGFRLDLLYKDDATGVAVNTLQNSQTEGIPDRTLLNLTEVDVLDQNGIIKEEGDGYFDYIEGVTAISETGTIIFPTLEPFGRDMEKLLDAADDAFLFKELYTETQNNAKNEYQVRDKYLIKGYYKSDASNGIALGAYNVPRGSVKVTSNGLELTEGVDYVVDYLAGRVQIINPSIEASGAPVQVSVENNTLFNQQRKSYIGFDVEHIFSEKLLMTGTFINVNETPVTQKTSYGQDPVNNSMFGLTMNYDTEVPLLTKLVNKLPFQDTDAPSHFSLRGDFAYLQPGTSKATEIDGEATTYVDDFEGVQIPISLMDPKSWKLSSVPIAFLDGATEPTLEDGKDRARLAWYSIDRLFYGGSLQPPNIDNEELSRVEVSRVEYSELFPATDLDVTQSNTLTTFDLAYYPKERGSYNYDTNVDENGDLNAPEERWGGITRAMTTTDFQQANVEYIQFWMQDPYENYSIKPEEGAPLDGNPIREGKLHFNLGNISEDILRDSRKMYENGLPESGDEDNTDETVWGKIPTNKSFVYSFTELDADRQIQDIGLDGLNDAEEQERYGNLVSGNDPASDNYRFFRGSQYDQEDASILTRYKAFNNTQGNSPTASLSQESYPTAATSIPDAEDINKDQTMNTIDAYYDYEVDLKGGNWEVGDVNGYIVDKKTVARGLETGGTQQVTWYQFRIPVTSGVAKGGITDFTSIRFMRMYLTGFKTPVVLRLADYQLIRGDWRRYTKNAQEEDLTQEELEKFTTGVVNIEENASRVPIPYVLPPGIEREQLQGAVNLQYQNEQSISVKIEELPPGEARTVYKNAILDLRMYKKLKMFIHAEALGNETLEKDDIVAIFRMGSDLDDNYYQIEVPLTPTAHTETSAEAIWPEENNLEVDLEALGILKVQRYADGAPVDQPYPARTGEVKYAVRVKGNPNLSNIKTFMMGVENASNTDKGIELWFNELRVAGFDNKGGWATVLNANANFADLADVAVTGRMQTIGFGSVEQKVNERSQEEIKQYGVATNVNVGKLMPQNWGIKIPLSYSVSEEFKDPKYDPQYQDVKFEDAKEINPNSESATDYTKRRSINLINVRKERVGEVTKMPMPYDIENFSVSYSYSDMFHKDYNVQKHLTQDLRTSAAYTFTFQPKPVEPFKNSKWFSNEKYFKLVKDFNFNYLPTKIGVNSSITRSYNEQLSRNLVEGLSELPTLKQRNFLFDWDYNIGYDLSRSLILNFRAANFYIYDDFIDVNGNEEDVQLYDNFFNLGRASQYTQKFDLTYKIPIDKLPYLGFLTSNVTYSADFQWQAGSKSYIKEVGNTIQNANTINWSTNMNLDQLYKDTNFESLFVPSKKSKSNSGKSGAPKFALPASKKVGGSSTNKSTKEVILKGVYDLITSVKTIRLGYAENNGTLLPGYDPSIGFLGRDNYGGGLAPTLGFVFGDQTDIRQEALNKDWLTTRNVNYASDTNREDDSYYSKTYTQTHYDKFDVSFNVKPINDLDIVIVANRIHAKNTSQQIDAINDNNGTEDPNDDIRRLGDTQLTESGNFNMSYSMIRTSFDGNGDETFQEFLNNRAVIQERLATERGHPIDGYGLNSAEVLMPAFSSAYSGGNASDEGLSPFKNIPLPNWRLTYKGLMKNKWIKKTFSSFVISHGYSSSYTIGNFSNNLQYEEDENGIPEKDINGNYFSEVLVSNLTLNDGFSPLIKVDLKLKNSLSFRGTINKDRTLALSLNNNTLSDVRGTEYVFGLGYRVKDLKFRTSFGGKRRQVKGNLNMKADISYRQNLSVIRTVDTDNNDTQITGGQDIFGLKLSADYNLSKNLIATFYYDQTASKYAISTTFPRQSVSTGISITYNLGN